MNSDVGGYFLGVFSRAVQKYPTPLIPVCRFVKSTLWEVCTTLLVSQLPVCISSYFIYTLIIGLVLISKPQNMVITLKFPNSKSYPGRHEKCELRRTEKSKRSHMKEKKTVIQCKRNQSQNVVPYETLPEINLLQARVPFQKNTRVQKMHSPKPGCYDHVTGES